MVLIFERQDASLEKELEKGTLSARERTRKLMMYTDPADAGCMIMRVGPFFLVRKK